MTTENTYKFVSQIESKKNKKLSCTFRYSCPYCQHQLIANLFKNVYCGQRIDVCIHWFQTEHPILAHEFKRFNAISFLVNYLYNPLTQYLLFGPIKINCPYQIKI